MEAIGDIAPLLWTGDIGENSLKTLLTITLAQIDVHTGQPEANLARVREFAAQAQKADADLLLLPELWLYGYDLKRAEDWAVPLGEGGFAYMATLAREFGLHIAGSLLERHAGGVSNLTDVPRGFSYLIGLPLLLSLGLSGRN